jgi:hypothetical protein
MMARQPSVPNFICMCTFYSCKGKNLYSNAIEINLNFRFIFLMKIKPMYI